jgi:putative transposase
MMKDTVFQLLMKPITENLIKECTKRFRSDHDCVSFNTAAHLQTMIFAHINELRSLRTLEVALNSQPISTLFKVKRSTLSDANCRRSADCFFWILQQLMFLLPRTIRKDINKAVKLLDSTPIKLKGQGYDEWVKQYATAHWQGVKLHVEFDLELECPTKVAMSYANFNDSSMGRRWPVLSDTVYVFDKGYCDYNWWWSIHKKQAYFVTRLKNNAAIVMENVETVVSEVVLEDGMFKLKNKHPRGGKKNLYTSQLRRIVVKREGKKPLVLVTNLFSVPAETIAALYKARWDVELFFKWIKQNLRIKKFFGRSANAVKIQVATALIAYVLVFLFKMNSENKRSLQLLLIWLRFNLSCNKFTSTLKHDPPIYSFKQRFLVSTEGVYL